jgi:hypothetical protein
MVTRDLGKKRQPSLTSKTNAVRCPGSSGYSHSEPFHPASERNYASNTGTVEAELIVTRMSFLTDWVNIHSGI